MQPRQRSPFPKDDVEINMIQETLQICDFSVKHLAHSHRNPIAYFKNVICLMTVATSCCNIRDINSYWSVLQTANISIKRIINYRSPLATIIDNGSSNYQLLRTNVSFAWWLVLILIPMLIVMLHQTWQSNSEHSTIAWPISPMNCMVCLAIVDISKNGSATVDACCCFCC